MTVPAAVPDGEHHRGLLHPLPDYEPDDDPDDAARRWSSMRPVKGPQLRLVPPLPEEQLPGRPRVPPVELARVLRHVLEVLDGRRPVEQLRSMLPDTAFESMLTRLRLVSPGGRHRLRGMRMCYPAPTALEVCVTIDYRPPKGRRRRVIAAAARFDHDGEQWLCTVFRLL